MNTRCDNCNWGGRAFALNDDGHLFCSPVCMNKYYGLKKGDEGYWHDKIHEKNKRTMKRLRKKDPELAEKLWGKD